MRRVLAWIALALLLAGCGGGSSVPTQQPPPVQVSVTLLPASQQNIDEGQSVRFTASVVNDTANQGVSWSLSGSGCSGAACGALTGATATAATYNAPSSLSSGLKVSVTARAVKDANVSRSTPVAVAPAPAIATTSLPGGTPGAPYSATLQATGGTGSLSWSISAGSLPDGLGLEAGSGAISGTPAKGGTWSFTARVTDSAAAPLSAQKPLSLTIVSRNLQISTPSLPEGTRGVAYSATLEAAYAVLPVSWGITAGSLPSGLALNQTSGLISGTPTATETSEFTVTVTDSSTPAQHDSQQLSITINPGGAENALLSGHYAFLLSGYDTYKNPVAVAGSFFADGSGGIQNGVEDINSFAAGRAPGLTFSGTYAVGADARGTLTFTNSQGRTFTLATALGGVSSGIATRGSVLEFDSSGYTMSGTMHRQDPNAFLQSALAGSYVFSFTGWDRSVHRLGAVGRFTADGSGGLTKGLWDGNDDGAVIAKGTFTGAYTAPDLPSGRLEATLAGISPAPAMYAFYVVAATKWLAISLDDPGPSGLVTGEAGAQSGGPFTESHLSGINVVSLESAASQSGAGSQVKLGLATFDGNGTFSFSLDVNDAGAASTLNTGGTCTVDSSGRFTLSPQSAPELVGYLTESNQGFTLDTGAGVATGFLEPQQGQAGSFSASSLDGGFYFASKPFAAPPAPPPLGGPTASLSVGVMAFDGGGNLSGTKDSNQMGSLSASQKIQDAYSVSSNGRTTLGSGSMILYVVSPHKVLSLSLNPRDPNPTLGAARQ